MDPISQPGPAKARSKRWLLAAGIALGVLLLWVGPCVLFVVKVAGSLGWVGGEGAGLIVTISEETTHIERPLDEEGYVDYIAALNERNREGVTPENNAAVLLWQAIGPAEILGYHGEEGCRRLFGELGVAPLPEEGDYFVSLDDHSRELDEAGPPPQPRPSDEPTPTEDVPGSDNWWALLREQSGRASERPWSSEESPELAAWLDRNEAPLGLVVEASRRERFYSPMIRPQEPPEVMNTLLPATQRSRDVCRALAIRAMLRLHEGDTNAAKQDLLACHRWARLIGQGPFLIEALVAYAIDGIACSGDTAFADHGKLTTDEIRQYRADLGKLGPLPNMADKIDVAERYQFLDSMIALARGGPGVMDGSYEDEEEEEDRLEQLLWQKGGNRAINWDTILRMGNQNYDRVAEITRIANRPERARAIRELDEEIDRQTEADTDLKSLAKSFLSKGPRGTVTEKIGQVSLALLMPSLSAALTAEDRAIVTLRLADASLALAAYRADHGGYPEKLAELVPDYVDEVPRDVFTDDELR
ncbi:MAG: hypothetical protein HQ582_32425, partial [Planctomycetes bacterium]|nr:hypothetical protein [Planctomycetota bacterium]